MVHRGRYPRKRLPLAPDGSESSERLIRQLAGKAAFDKVIPLSGFDELFLCKRKEKKNSLLSLYQRIFPI